MIRTLTAAACLYGSVAQAEVSLPDQTAILAVMEDYGASFGDGTIAEFYRDTFHPTFWKVLADQQGQPTAQFLEDTTVGTRAHFEGLEVRSFDVIEETAVYGQSLGWTWAVVATERELKWPDRESDGLSCNAMFVFGQDGEWFISGLGSALDILLEAIPALAAASFDAPSCVVPGT